MLAGVIGLLVHFCRPAITRNLADVLELDPLINPANSWASVAGNVTIRYFSPVNYPFSIIDPKLIWALGKDINCTMSGNGSVEKIRPPSTFQLDFEIRLLTHGFDSTVIDDDKALFVHAWMLSENRTEAVVLVDWAKLAKVFQFNTTSNAFYDEAARNCIDVGNYVGRCLASAGLEGSNLHLVGHSLGAHLVGKAARVIHARTGSAVRRVTGLDPAGPRFEAGELLPALPDLAVNILSRQSAVLVDVIHTDGGLEPCALCPFPRLGALQELGHMDFYPSGGAAHQPGCKHADRFNPLNSLFQTILCNHQRAIYYFYHSIMGPQLFPSRVCQTVELCRDHETTGEVVAYMGQPAEYSGKRTLYYNTIDFCDWKMTGYSGLPPCTPLLPDDEEDITGAPDSTSAAIHVNCGGHHSAVCEDGAAEHGPKWCNGDCSWQEGRCVKRNEGNCEV